MSNPSLTLDRRQVLRAAGAGAAAAAVSPLLGSSLLTAPAQAATATKLFPLQPDPGFVFWGASLPSSLTIADFEKQMGGLGSRRSFIGKSSGTATLVARAKDDIANNRFPVLSTKLPGSWTDMAAGKHNAWFDGLVNQLASFQRAMTLTLHHEPENDVNTSGNTAAAYKKMYDYLVPRCEALSGGKVFLMQIFMSWTFDPKSGRKPADWISDAPKIFGMDAYNTFDPAYPNKPWVTLPELIARFAPYAGNKPVVLAEIGCRNDPADPNRAPKWIRDSLTAVVSRTQLPGGVIAANYFNTPVGGGTYSYELSTDKMKAAFKANNSDARTIVFQPK